jgi:hypothetical protein
MVSLYVGYISACPFSTHGFVLESSALKSIVLLLFFVVVVVLMALRAA